MNMNLSMPGCIRHWHRKSLFLKGIMTIKYKFRSTWRDEDRAGLKHATRSQKRQMSMPDIKRFPDKQMTATREAVAKETSKRLKKTILKLVFSFGGISTEIDTEIETLKARLRSAREEDRREIIEDSVDAILSRINSLKSGLKDAAGSGQNYFVDFLDGLSLPGELDEEITRLRQEVKEIQEEQQYLELVNRAIQLFCSVSGTEREDRLRLINLLEQLSLPAEATERLVLIRDEIANNQYASLFEANKKIGKVINAAHAGLQHELDDITRYLNRLIGQLSVLYGHLQSTEREHGISCKEAENLNNQFLQHSEDLQAEMDQVTDLESLKQSVDSHMNKLQTSLKEHLASERQRKRATEERVSELKSRLQKMENETLGLKEKLNQERTHAYCDVLTGISNRLSYDEQIIKEIARSKRYKKPLSLAVIDIDYFKKINDRFGHKAGDKVLKAVATVCKENIRDSDFLARYGGEEFVLLLPETDVEEAGIAVENLRRVVESCNFYHQNQTVLVTVSIGFTELQPGDDNDGFFNRADKALYAAKSGGRNLCMSSDEIVHTA